MSRAVTLAGYWVLGTAAVVYELVGRILRRTPTLIDAFALLSRTRPGRLLVLAGWLWVGWHFFVRTHR